MKWLSTLTVNERLALAALLLGVGAAFARPSGGATVKINPQELAAMVQRGEDRVAPEDIAEWIIEGRSDYRLVDVRDAAQYARYHIPTAENIPLTSLPEAEFAPTDKVVLYSDDGAGSAEASFLVRAKGLTGAYQLTGGMDAWKQRVLFPVISDGASQSSNAKLMAVSRHFGGAPRSAPLGATVAATAPEPALAESPLPPPPPISGGGVRPKAKKKEGC